ncbi:hypothetical protein Golob_001766, partial [Gossypium lobatum]|nr:hypothetical protein [Gossypium lobatum]
DFRRLGSPTKTIQDSQLVNSNSTLAKRILQLLQYVGYLRIKHISKEDNRVADSLVKMLTDKDHNVQVFEEVPRKL